MEQYSHDNDVVIVGADVLCTTAQCDDCSGVDKVSHTPVEYQHPDARSDAVQRW